MRILFINQCYWPDHASSAQHLTDLAEGLAARGHDVTVLCSRHPYVGGGAVFPRHERRQGVLIHRVATLGYGKQAGIRGRTLDYLSFHLMALLKGMRLPSADVIVTLTSPLLVGVLGWLLALLKRTRHVHWCMDLFPDTGVLFGIVKARGPAHRLCTFFTRRYLRGAAGIVAISPYMIPRLQRYGAAPDRIHVVPVWAVGKDLRPIPRQTNGFRREHGLQDKFVVMFSGNLELGGDMDTLLGALAQLRDDPEILFVLISEGPRMEKFREMSARAGLPNVVFLPYQDRDTLAYSLSAGDVHVITNKVGLGGLRVPGKTYGILAVARPILYIGEPCCEVADLVRDHRLGFVIREHDVQNLVSAIRKLRADPVGREEISVRARALFEAHYQAQGNIDLWERLLTSRVAPEARCAADGIPARIGAVRGGFAHEE